MSSEQIKLNLINQSGDTANSVVVIFGRNVAQDFDQTAMAWRVIQDLGRGDNHPFSYPLAVTVGASDSWGNDTPQFSAQNGDAFDMMHNPSGDILQRSTTPSNDPNQIEVRNKLTKGAISANIFRDGKLFSTLKEIAPDQVAAFQFHPRIFIGVLPAQKQGCQISGAAIADIHTELNLVGIQSADIVWTGGGPGPDSEPFEFRLENINP